MAFMGAIIAILFVALLGKGVYDMYFGDHSSRYEQETVCHCDTTCAPTCLTLMTMFDNSQDVLIAQSDLQEEVKYIDAFRDMPTDVTINVSTMLFKRRADITIKDLVDEYNSNRIIYDNLKPDAVTHKLDKEPDPLGQSVTTNVIVNDSSNSNPPNNGK